MDEKNFDPMVVKVYNYLCENHKGYANGISKPDLANHFNITTRELRKITSEINNNLSFDKVVSTTHICYVCDSKEECEKSIKNTFKMAIALFKKANKMRKKVGLNGQVLLEREDYNEIFNTFGRK